MSVDRWNILVYSLQFRFLIGIYEIVKNFLEFSREFFCRLLRFCLRVKIIKV